jgi:hypothetical protein
VRIILKWIEEMGYEDVVGIHLSESGDQWWALENSVINLRIP